MGKATIVAGLAAQRDATVRRLAALPEPAWTLPCPLPAPVPGLGVPRVRDLVVHLVLGDECLASTRRLVGSDAARRLDRARRWDAAALQRFDAAATADLVDRLLDGGDRLLRIVGATPAVVGRLPIRGRGLPVLRLLAMRVVHEWVHEHDIALATGVPGPVATQPAPDVAGVLTYALLERVADRVLPRIDRSSGVVRLVVDPEPSADAVPAGRLTWNVDFARRQFGVRVTATPDAKIETTAAALALLLARRLDWRAATPDHLRVSGDAELADALLGGLSDGRAAAMFVATTDLAATGTDG